MAKPSSEIDQLSDLATSHDEAGVRGLLGQHRTRLKRMIAAGLDPRLASRVDASDVVQETLVDAVNRLSDYLKERPLPVYPWLRQLAAERMAKLAGRHLHAQKRSVLREVAGGEPYLGLSEDMIDGLAQRVAARQKSPSQEAASREQRGQVRQALQRLPYVDREFLVMRFIEQLTTAETAANLGISPDAVRMRRLRALRALAKEMKE